jgi:hypothetical protein
VKGRKKAASMVEEGEGRGVCAVRVLQEEEENGFEVVVV